MNSRDEHASPDREMVVDQAFAKRMKIACDNIARMPAGKGRAAWLHRELTLRGVKTSLNSVYRWYMGTMRPRHDNLVALAEILKVDTEWLSNGILPEITLEDRRRAAVTADASVNILMGFIQMENYQCAAPDEEDPLSGIVHFYSIINGRQRRFHACPGEEDGSSHTFTITTKHDKCTVVGVISSKPFQAEFIRIPNALIEKHAESKNGFLKLTATASPQGWRVGDAILKPLQDVKELGTD